MRRRDLILGLGGALALPRAVRAQQKAVPTIGYMSGGSASFYAGIIPAFREGLREAGYVEGENVRIDYRWRRAITSDCPRSPPNSFAVAST